MRLRTLLFSLLLAGLWGPSFLFIKVAVHDLPPFTLVAGRMAGGSLLLYLLLRLRGGRLPSLKESRATWKHMAVLAFLGTAFPFVLVGWGEQHIDSALASILNATVPIFTLLLAHLFTDDDRLTRAKVIGAALGMVGTVILIAPAMQGGLHASALGLLAVAFSAFCYGAAGVYAKLHVRGLPAFAAPAMQFGLSALMLAPLSLGVDRPWTLPTPSTAALGAWLALILLGTVAAFAVYYHMLEFASASTISMTTYMMPVIGILLGVLVLDEDLHWNAYAGGAAILGGVIIVNGLPGKAATR